MRGVVGRADDHEVVVHHGLPAGAVALLHEVLLGGGGVDRAARRRRRGAPSSIASPEPDRHGLHPAPGGLLEGRQQLVEQPGVAGARGRGSIIVPRSGAEPSPLSPLSSSPQALARSAAVRASSAPAIRACRRLTRRFGARPTWTGRSPASPPGAAARAALASRSSSGAAAAHRGARERQLERLGDDWHPLKAGRFRHGPNRQPGVRCAGGNRRRHGQVGLGGLTRAPDAAHSPPAASGSRAAGASPCPARRHAIRRPSRSPTPRMPSGLPGASTSP